MPYAALTITIALLIVARGAMGTARAAEPLATTNVFVSGEEGYHTYRIPSLLVTKQGTLLAFCEGRKTGRADDGDIDLTMRRSEDGGDTWQAMDLVHEEGGDAKTTIGNPCPVVDEETGRIWMPFCRDNKTVHVTYSDDDGRTWATPSDITADVKRDDWTWYATGPGVGIQLRHGPHKGRLVIPCDHFKPVDGKSVTHSHVIYSDDQGRTWQLGGTVGPYTNECQVVELTDGTLLVNMRNHWHEGPDKSKHGHRIVATSDDGGTTWSACRFDQTLIAPTCEASLIRYDAEGVQRDDWLMFSNPASQKTRHRLTVRLSRNGGHTWSSHRLIHDGPAAYSCLAMLPDGTIGCLYECGEKHPYERIAYTRLSLHDLNTGNAPANDR